MDNEEKKAAQRAWKERHPEMGAFCIKEKGSGEAFAGISKDTEREFNKHQFQLNANMHPNKRLQELWNELGEESFEYSVLALLKYDDPEQDQRKDLEALLEQCLAVNQGMKKI